MVCKIALTRCFPSLTVQLMAIQNQKNNEGAVVHSPKYSKLEIL